MTTEWKLKTGENSVKYTVNVAKFRKKINSFKAGRSIWSKDFKVGRTVFCLDIKPSGKESNSPHVAVYLHNKSDWDVYVDVRFVVGDCKREAVKQRFGREDSPTQAFGFPDMVPHDRCNNGDLLNNGILSLEVNIENVYEEVLPHHDIEDEMKSHVDEKFDELVMYLEHKQRMASIEIENSQLMRRLDVTDTKIFLSQHEVISKMKSHVDEKLEEREDKFTRMEQRMEQRMASIEIGNSQLMTRLDVIGRQIFTQFQLQQSIDLECPICTETVKPPMRLYQCGQVGSKY